MSETQAPRRATREAPLAAVALLSLALALVIAVEPFAAASPSDFLTYYYAAKAAAAHLDFYDTPLLREMARADGTAGTVWPYFYPPFLAHAMSPLAGLSLRAYHLVWLAALVGSTGLIGLACAGAQRLWTSAAHASELVARKDAVLVPFAVAAVLLLALPIRNNFVMGQVNLIVVALLALSGAAYFAGRPATAGALLAPAVLIKTTPLVMLGFLAARRSGRGLAGFGVASVALAGGTLFAGGLHSWPRFFRVFPTVFYGEEIPNLFPPAAVWNFSAAGLMERLLVNHPGTTKAFAVLVTLLALLAASLFAYHARGRRAEALAAALFLPTMILASPLAFVHHGVYVAPAAALWLTWAWSEGKTWLFGGTVLLLAVYGLDWPVLYPGLGAGFRSAAAQGINLYALAALYGVGIEICMLERGAPSAQRA